MRRLVPALLTVASAVASCAFPDDYVFVEPEPPGDCGDRVLNGRETDTDCGGPRCDGCSEGQPCQEGRDCRSLVCEDGTCQPPSCSDGAANGTETGRDCGGNCEAKCPAGESCVGGVDCE